MLNLDSILHVSTHFITALKQLFSRLFADS
jgi:hypothetical protein